VAGLEKLKNLSAWPKKRREIEAAIHSVLGKLPKTPIDLQTKVMDEQDFPGFTRRRVNYFVDEWNRISAWVFVPPEVEDCPAILCLHGMTPYGKDQPAGLEGNEPLLAFARHYAEMGYVTLAPDCIATGERLYSRLDPFDTKTFYKDNPKMSAMGKMLWDHMRGIDLLSEVREVDSARIGVIGHDMGSYNALMLAAFDERIGTCVASCGITCFAEDDAPERWLDSSGLVLLPKLQKAVESGDFPFDWDEVLALIAPNPTLLITALNDEVLSNTGSVDDAVKRARGIYGLLGAEKAMENFAHKDGHNMTTDALDAADAWFDRWL